MRRRVSRYARLSLIFLSIRHDVLQRAELARDETVISEVRPHVGFAALPSFTNVLPKNVVAHHMSYASRVADVVADIKGTVRGPIPMIASQSARRSLPAPEARLGIEACQMPSGVTYRSRSICGQWSLRVKGRYNP